MAESVIKVSGLGKKYQLRQQGAPRYQAMRDVLAGMFRRSADTSRKKSKGEEFWALRDISFEVPSGQVVGIIGRNGAGKSTLLKILSQIVEPTTGSVYLEGRVASLLEVGTGFHPELSGRENIFLNGAILGMGKKEIVRKFDEIVAFAEVEKFLDTPVKHYSSGMYVRLAFAVAAHLEPDILVVDEVLAVGDAEFQKKSLNKMNQVSKQHGRTVLFVSHNLGMISSLCTSAIWLDKGSVRNQGAAQEVVDEYLRKNINPQGRLVPLEGLPRQFSYEQRLRLLAIEWLCNLPLQHGEPAKARITFQVNSPLSAVTVGIGFSTLDGRRLLTYETDFQEGYRPDIVATGLYSVDVLIDSLPLAPDTYALDVGCRSGDFFPLDYVVAAADSEVVPGPWTPPTIVRGNAGVRLRSDWTWNN